MLKFPHKAFILSAILLFFLSGCGKLINEKEFVEKMKVSFHKKSNEFNQLADVCGQESVYQRIKEALH